MYLLFDIFTGYNSIGECLIKTNGLDKDTVLKILARSRSYAEISKKITTLTQYGYTVDRILSNINGLFDQKEAGMLPTIIFVYPSISLRHWKTAELAWVIAAWKATKEPIKSCIARDGVFTSACGSIAEAWASLFWDFTITRRHYPPPSQLQGGLGSRRFRPRQNKLWKKKQTNSSFWNSGSRCFRPRQANCGSVPTTTV